MAGKLLFFSFLTLFSLSLVSTSPALEKMKIGTDVKISPGYYLPLMAAEEKGFWKDNGLDGEWVPFAGTGAHFVAVAAAAINIGISVTPGPVLAAERGAPVIMVADLEPDMGWSIWVRAASPYRHPRELKATKFGTPRLGGTSHAYGRLVAKAQGLEKDVRYVAAGGLPETLAAMKVGAVDWSVQPVTTMIGLKLEGAVREIGTMADYVPKPWTDQVIFARKDFARSKPEVVRQTLKAIFQALDFALKNPRWSMDKIKNVQGFSEEAAKFTFERLRFSRTGRLERKAVENMRNVFIEYAVITEKAPPVDDLFTNEFVS